MNNRVDINSYSVTKEKMTIRCESGQGFYHSSVNSAGIRTSAVLEAFLIDMGLESAKDYTVIKSDSLESASISIDVIGKANVILALNLLLSKKKLFYIPNTGFDDTYTRWQRVLGEYIVSALEDKKITRQEMEKLHALTQQTLDEVYLVLKNEPYIGNLPNKEVNEETHGQFLKHPFFQLLSLAADDFELRHNEYKNKGIFQKIGAKKPDEKGYDDIFKRYQFVIPVCYCKTESRFSGFFDKIGIDAAKIKQSREEDHLLKFTPKQ